MYMESTIPKKIHYCWFGENEKTEEILRCIESWKKFLPEYEIIEWNEENYDIDNSIQYVKEAYDAKKWAFVSDYVRLDVLYKYGGIYLDTDVEIFQSFDGLLENVFFAGFESKDYVATAILGSQLKSEIVQSFMKYYNTKSFCDAEGNFETEITNVVIFSDIIKNYGIKLNGKYQKNSFITVYPQKYFCSNDILNIIGKYSRNIYAYHHCMASWYDVQSKRSKLRRYLIGKLRNIIGTSRLYNLKHRS